MSKRARQQAPETLARRLEAGRGLGTGRTYKPWTTIQDFAGLTKCSRIKGWKTDRIHDLLSPLELEVFFLLEWNATITDIREQFPLPLNATLETASELGVPHPTAKAGNPYTLTSTFLLNQGETLSVVEVAYANQIHKAIQIKTRYWEKLGIPSLLHTEKTFNRVEAQNIGWLHPYRNKPPKIDEAECFQTLTRKRIKEGCTLLDKTHGHGSAIQSIRCFLAQKIWETDLTKEIEWDNPLPIKNRNVCKELHHRVA